jgi:hypothetical protein
MTEVMEKPTAEEIARHYSAALDSVALINNGKPEDMEADDWADTVKRNVDHLNIQLAKPEFYEGYDLTPFENAVK